MNTLIPLDSLMKTIVVEFGKDIPQEAIPITSRPTITCPCCQTEFDVLDSKVEFERVLDWKAKSIPWVDWE